MSCSRIVFSGVISALPESEKTEPKRCTTRIELAVTRDGIKCQLLDGWGRFSLRRFSRPVALGQGHYFGAAGDSLSMALSYHASASAKVSRKPGADLRSEAQRAKEDGCGARI